MNPLQAVAARGRDGEAARRVLETLAGRGQADLRQREVPAGGVLRIPAQPRGRGREGPPGEDHLRGRRQVRPVDARPLRRPHLPLVEDAPPRPGVRQEGGILGVGRRPPGLGPRRRTRLSPEELPGDRGARLGGRSQGGRRGQRHRVRQVLNGLESRVGKQAFSWRDRITRVILKVISISKISHDFY